MQRLVRVAKSRVGDQQPLLPGDPVGELPRSEFEQELPRAGRRCHADGRSRGPGLSRRASPGWKPLAWGLPLTMTLPRKFSSLVARSRRGLNAKSSGVVSISVVVAWPLRNSGCAMTFSRNGMLVLTPRIRNSRKRAMHAVHRDVVGLAAGDCLHEQRIVEGRDDRAGVAHAAVEPDAEAARRPVGEQCGRNPG